MFKKNPKTKNGYTIIETMIAISLFIIIVMAGMGALLNANLLSQKSKDMRSIIDNLSFIVEDMSRNLRTGYDYHCITEPTVPRVVVGPQNCDFPGKGGISFKPQDFDSMTNNFPLVYYISSNLNDNRKLSIFKIANGGSDVQLTPDEVDIDPVSSFVVSGAGLGDGKQPFVTIKIAGSITFKGVTSPFSLQTSVSQRKLDF